MTEPKEDGRTRKNLDEMDLKGRTEGEWVIPKKKQRVVEDKAESQSSRQNIAF